MIRLARKKYSCDFETTTKIDDCRVWAYGLMEIGNIENYRIGNSLNEFMEWVEDIKADLYFHNLRFDGEFIVNWLLKNGYEYSETPRPKTFKSVISKMGQWYMIDICYGYKGKNKLHTVIYDSLKKLPFPVKQIAKDFGLPILKGDIDYHAERPIGHEITEEEYSYIKNDIEIIARALEIQFSQGLTKMTNGSDSLAGFKAVVSKQTFEHMYPVFSHKMDKNLRLAYRGGFTWLNDRYENVEIGEGLIFDVNSLYPSQMYYRDLPFGEPIPFEGEYVLDKKYPLYIQHIRCSFKIKENHIPTIQIKRSLRHRENEYLKTSNGEIEDLYLTNIDWELIQEHYIIEDLEFVSGWKFKKAQGNFKQFIDYWTHIKVTSTGAIKLLAKLMLNSLYGKFASNPDVTGKIPYLKEDGSCGFRIGEEEFKDPIYTPLGVFITSWARYTTISTAQKCYDRIIYCDTDSIHLVGTEIPSVIEDIIDDNKLGYWAHESTFKKVKDIRQKTYVNELYKKDGTTEIKVKCAGMPEKVKNKLTRIRLVNMPKNVQSKIIFNRFKVGYTNTGKLLPKHVNGGVVLIDTEFTIK